MENRQSSQQHSDGESKREYKSPTLRKLGNLTYITLTTNMGSTMLDGMGGSDKTA